MVLGLTDRVSASFVFRRVGALVHYFLVLFFCLFVFVCFFKVKWGVLEYVLVFLPKQLHAALILAYSSSFVSILGGSNSKFDLQFLSWCGST